MSYLTTRFVYKIPMPYYVMALHKAVTVPDLSE